MVSANRLPIKDLRRMGKFWVRKIQVDPHLWDSIQIPSLPPSSTP